VFINGFEFVDVLDIADHIVEYFLGTYHFISLLFITDIVNNTVHYITIIKNHVDQLVLIIVNILYKYFSHYQLDIVTIDFIIFLEHAEDPVHYDVSDLQ